VNRDGLALVIRDLNVLILERYTKFHDIARQQLLWILREVLRNAITGSDSLIYNLLRQIAGGDVSPKNVWLAEHMLDLLSENRAWLERHSILLATTVYTFLRLIVDHYGPLYAPLRQREVDFCIGLLRERFTECLVIGRDLVRLLQDVARLPEFEALWRDITHNPTSLSPTFTGILSLLQTRTSRRFLQSRLTPDMERKITFLTSHVKFGQQKRFQEWFQRQYLSTPESQGLRCDLIRFICCVIHPTNEVLCSEIIPRWAVIGWILSSCTSPVAAANAKLALFYDWLFFDPERDNIMNIEPAILVMYYSLRTHPVITVTLLDFLCRITRHFSIALAVQVRKGVCSALTFILEKRVLQSLSALFESPKIDRELRLLVRECFPEFCSPNPDAIVQPTLPPSQPIPGFPLEPSNGAQTGVMADCQNGAHLPPITDETLDSRFSDDECEVLEPDENLTNHITTTTTTTNTAAITSSTTGSMTKPIPPPSQPPPATITPPPPTPTAFPALQVVHKQTNDLTQLASDFPSPIRNLLQALRSEPHPETRSDLVTKLLHNFWLQKDSNEREQIESFASAISIALHDDFSTRIPIDNTFTAKPLSSSVNTPIFVIIRNLLQSDENVQGSFTLCSSLCSHLPLFGCLILYFATITSTEKRLIDFDLHTDLSEHPIDKLSSNEDDHLWIAYKRLAIARSKSLSDALHDDLSQCQMDNVDLFAFLVPEVFRRFSGVCVDNTSFVQLIAGAIDSRQLQTIVWEVIQGRLQLFTEDSIVALLEESLLWESFEQFCVWQLVAAHSFSIDQLLPILFKIDSHVHSEATLQLLMILKQERPTGELLKTITSPEVLSGEYFSGCLFNCWTYDHEDVLADLICTQLSKGTPSKKRRVAAGSKAALAAAAVGSLPPANEQLLIHLDSWSKSSSNAASFLSRSSIQSSLVNTLSICNELQKSKFNDLFTLTDDTDDALSTDTTSARSKANATSNNSAAHSLSNNSSGNSVAATNKGRAKNKTTTADDAADVDSTSTDQPPKSKKKKL
jgi:integrator complex subunit 3